MSEDRPERSWFIRKARMARSKAAPFDSKQASVIGPDTEPVRVVELSRLREVEAVIEKMRGPSTCGKHREARPDCRFCAPPLAEKYFEAEARAERAEGELREAREALRELFDATEASEECWVLSSVLARARGVLEKDKKDKEDTRA